MVRKKQPDLADIVDDLTKASSPTSNGHDAEGLAIAEEAGDVDEMLDAEPVKPRRKRASSSQLADEAKPDKPDKPDKPARGGRSSRSRRKRSPDGAEILDLPLVPLRDMVIFPHMVTSLFVGRQRSLKAIDAALNEDRVLVAVAQRDPTEEDVGPNDLYEMGVELVIGRSLKMPDGTSSLLVQGQRRLKVLRVIRTEPYMKAEVEAIEEPVDKSQATDALMRAVLALFKQVVDLSHNLSEDSYVAAMNVDEPGWLADLIASSITLDQERRQQILETADPIERLQLLSIMLAKELDVLNLENRIHDRVQNEVDKSQREYYLREQLKAIAQELGEEDPATREINELRGKIEAASMPEEVQKKAFEELARLQGMPMGTPEVGVIRTYLDWLIALPWANQTADHLDIKAAAKVLDVNHYGLAKVKERILEYMAVRKLAQGKMRSPILCFVGPPGVGKTSLGRSIAEALGRRFVRVSLGGIRDEAEIRGHRRTYIGAMPGRIIQTMKTAGTVNPVFMMDEIDKVGTDFRGDPSAALLEVLDPEQNNAFSDHYLDVPYNLSKVLFIMTANILDPVPPALLDRMEVIELPGYIEDEKYHIARQFLVPRQIEENGLTKAHIRFTDAALRRLIREYTHEAGVRNLEREIGTICRKVAKQVAEDMPTELEQPEVQANGQAAQVAANIADRITEPLNGHPAGLDGNRETGIGNGEPDDAIPTHDARFPISPAAKQRDGEVVETEEAQEQDAVSDMAPAPVELAGTGRRLRARVIHEKDIETFLGAPRFSYGMAEEQDEVGVATGVSVTSVGGDTIGVEVSVMEGRGNLLLTGQLGDVMKESAQAAVSYARARAIQLGIDPARFEKTDIHIHVPAGATPKDGPSAGITMATALVSALTQRRVRRDVAMTGEITLRGKVLPIGGLKEKVLAAHRAGISTFILPRKNEKDLDEIPAKVRKQIKLVPVDELDAVLKEALDPAPAEGKTPEPPQRAKAPTPRRRSDTNVGVHPS
jgi:ATP-dependent Lon protease